MTAEGFRPDAKKLMKELKLAEKNEKSEFRKQFHDALVSIRHSVERLHERLGIDPGFDLGTFLKVIDSKLLTRLDPDYPLMVAITGGGSTGKSSLFNSIVGKELSAVKAKAGLSRRVLVAIHPDVVEKPGFLESLFAAFGVVPEKMDSVEQLITPGDPVYVTCDSLPPNLVLLDTPDFDTGDGDNYANRHTAKSVLEASDVFLYIFTNATYNNLANTTFIREMLTGIGDRRAMMIYRCSRALIDSVSAKDSGSGDAILSLFYGDLSQQWWGPIGLLV
ncbi:MAG: GTPase [Kiritimatiellia bacterium]